MIHGRDQAFEVTEQLAQTWRGALDDGIRKLRAGGPLLQANDVQFLAYQDIYEPGYAPLGCGGGQVLSTAEQEEARTGKDSFLRWLSARAASIGLTSFVMTKLLSDTRTYFENADVRCDTDGRLVGALVNAARAKRPVVLLAHSLGSQIAYRVLTPEISDIDVRVERFVSVGSQLGAPEIGKTLSNGRFRRSPFPFPTRASAWVNIRGQDDYVAPLPIRDTTFVSPPPNSLFRGHVIETQPGSPHSIVGYLKHIQTARAIVYGWCQAFQGPTATRPDACRDVLDSEGTP